MDSCLLAYVTVALCAGVLLWYHLIGLVWFRSARRSGPEARAVWFLLLAIFVFCAWAGYGATIVALIWPRVAIPLRMASLGMVNLLCPLFLWAARRFRFERYGAQQAAGQVLMATPIAQMSDREIAALARAAVSEGLSRVEERLSP